MPPHDLPCLFSLNAQNKYMKTFKYIKCTTYTKTCCFIYSGVFFNIQGLNSKTPYMHENHGGTSRPRIVSLGMRI